MALGANSINITLGLNTSGFVRGLSAAEASATRFRRNLTETANAVGGALRSIGLPSSIGEGIQAITEKTIEFDAAMRNINSIAHLNQTEYAEFSNTILHLNDSIGSTVGPAEAARAAYEILSSGFTKTAEAQKILEAAVIAGTAGLSNAMSAAKLFTGVLNAYNMEADDVGHVSDVMFKTVELGVTTFDELARSIARVTPTANANNISIEELSSAVATLTVKGIRTNEAVTGIKRAITAIAAPTDSARKALEEMGLTSQMLTNTLTQEGLVPAMKLLMQATGENKEALRKLLGESTAINAAFALAGKDAGDTFEKISYQMREAAGSTSAAFAEQSKSLKVQIDQMKASFEVAAITVGGPFTSSMSNAVKSLKDVFDIVGHMPEYLDVAVRSWEEFGLGWEKIAAVAGGTAMASLLAGASGLAALSAPVAAGAAALTALAGAFLVVSGATRDWDGSLTGLLGKLPSFVEWMGMVSDPVSAAAGKIKDLAFHNSNMADSSLKAAEKTEDLAKSLKRLNDMHQGRDGEDAGKRFESMGEAQAFMAEAINKHKKAIQEINDSDLDENSKNAKLAREEQVYQRIILRVRQEYAWLEAEGKKKDKIADQELNRVKELGQANKKMYGDIEKYEEDVQDKQFATKKDQLQALEELMTKHKQLADSQINVGPGLKGTADPAIIAAMHDLARKKRKLAQEVADEESEMTERNFNERQNRLKKEAESGYAEGTLSYEQYMKKLKEIRDNYRQMEVVDSDKYGADAEQVEKKIADTKKAYLKQCEKDKRDSLDREYNISLKDLDRKRKLMKITYEEEAKELKKLSEDTRFTEEQRASARDKAAGAMANEVAKREKERTRQIKAEQDLNKEKVQTANEELEMLKRKAEVGIISEGAYIENVKKAMELKRQDLELDKQKALSAANGDEEEMKAIEEEHIIKLRQLEKAQVEEAVKNLADIKKAKGESVEMTEEMIKKEKEYLDLITNEGKGAVGSIDDFVKSMNTRWDSGERGPMQAGAAFKKSGFGNKNSRKALEKEIKDKRAGYWKFGFDPDSGQSLEEMPDAARMRRNNVLNNKNRTDSIGADREMLKKFGESLEQQKETNNLLRKIVGGNGSYTNQPKLKIKGDPGKNGTMPPHK